MEPAAVAALAALDVSAVVGEVAEGIFGIRKDRGNELHLCVLSRVAGTLESLGYAVFSEYPVTHSHYLQRQDWTLSRSGRMDLIAVCSDHRIAVEFDTDGILKKKTAEKLVESGTDYSIGISYGGCFRPSLGFATRDRIREALAHSRREGRPRRMWFIIVVRRVMEEVALG